MMNCAGCGVKNPVEAIFCSTCGIKQGPSTESEPSSPSDTSGGFVGRHLEMSEFKADLASNILLDLNKASNQLEDVKKEMACLRISLEGLIVRGYNAEDDLTESTQWLLNEVSPKLSSVEEQLPLRKAPALESSVNDEIRKGFDILTRLNEGFYSLQQTGERIETDAGILLSEHYLRLSVDRDETWERKWGRQGPRVKRLALKSKQLKSAERSLLLLRHQIGLTEVQIAKIEGESERAISLRIGRAENRVSELLALDFLTERAPKEGFKIGKDLPLLDRRESRILSMSLESKGVRLYVEVGAMPASGMKSSYQSWRREFTRLSARLSRIALQSEFHPVLALWWERERMIGFYTIEDIIGLLEHVIVGRNHVNLWESIGEIKRPAWSLSQLIGRLPTS